jgi:putative toxin-antitoxin system antitoxin component (TIGR02293 family)
MSVTANERVAAITAQAVRIFGTELDAREFLNRSHPVLNGRTPLDLASEGNIGAEQVRTLLGRLEAGTAP